MTEETRLLYRWLETLAEGLGLSGDVAVEEETVHILLDLARDAAHQVARPAAPLTTFLLGVAVGRGGDLEALAAQATRLALNQGDSAGDPA